MPFIKKLARHISFMAVVCASPLANANSVIASLNAYNQTGSTPPQEQHNFEPLPALQAGKLTMRASEADQSITASRPLDLAGIAGPESDRFEVSSKWEDLRSRMRTEEETIVTCRTDPSSCPEAGRRFLEIVELGLRREGRARLGEINRAVNLRIKPASDWVQHGVGDFWSAPLATLSAGMGDCEDYA